MHNKNTGNEHKLPFEGQAFLLTASDSIEAGIIESKLKASNIPVYKKYRGAGAYLNLVLGNTSMGIDLFVPKEKLDEAIGIINSASDISDEEILSDPSFYDEAVKKSNDEFIKNLGRKNRLIAYAFIAAVIALIILYLFDQ
ncbi:MAG: hypothetical protein ACOYIF_08245 [Acetivibrionales bacterium]|jgi:hypothetical protein